MILRNCQFDYDDATDPVLFETCSKLLRNSLERCAVVQNRWYIALRILTFTQSKHCTRFKSQFCHTQNRCTKIWTKIDHFWTLRARMRLDLLHQKHFHLVVDTISRHRNFRTNGQFFGQKYCTGSKGTIAPKTPKRAYTIGHCERLHRPINFIFDTTSPWALRVESNYLLWSRQSTSQHATILRVHS